MATEVITGATLEVLPAGPVIRAWRGEPAPGGGGGGGGVREFLLLATPLVASNVSMALMHFVDRIFLAWCGAAEIAAALPGGLLAITFLSVFIGVSDYTNALVAQAHGAGRNRQVAAATWQGIRFSVVAGLASLLLIPLGDAAFDLAGHPAEIRDLEGAYFSTTMAGGTFFILNGALSGFFAGIGRTGVVLGVTVAANVLNAVLDYGLIFGAFGLPRMGMVGAALGTVAATALMSLVYMVIFLSPGTDRVYATRRLAGHDRKLLATLLTYGVPSGIQRVMDLSSFTAFVLLLGQLGKVELAVSNIVLSLNSLAFWPMVGGHIATSTLVGQYLGRGDPESACRSTWSGFLVMQAYTLVFSVIYLTNPGPMLSLFMGAPEGSGIAPETLLDLGSRILAMVAVFQIADAANLAFSGSLRGAGDTRFLMWAGTLCAWFLWIPGTWVTVHVFGGGLMAAWAWATGYIVLLGILFAGRFLGGSWRTLDLLA